MDELCTCMLSHSVVSDSLQPHGLQPARLLCPCNSPGQNAGVGSCFLLRGIFPINGLNWGFRHCRWILFQLNYQGSPITLIEREGKRKNRRREERRLNLWTRNYKELLHTVSFTQQKPVEVDIIIPFYA